MFVVGDAGCDARCVYSVERMEVERRYQDDEKSRKRMENTVVWR